MRVVCKRRFRDLEANVLREVGDVFEASPERLRAINGTRYGNLVNVVEEGQDATPQRARRTRRTKE